MTQDEIIRMAREAGFNQPWTAPKLAEPDMNLSCKSVQARLATSWGYVKAEQAEQEPVAWMVYTADGQSVYVTDNPTDIKVGQRALPLYTAAIRARGEK